MSAACRWGLRVALALALAAALVQTGCGSRRAATSAAAADSSFAAVAFQRNLSPLELSVTHGGEVYGHYCAICHGESGGGDGFNAYNVTAAFGVSPTAFGDSASFHALNADTALAMIRAGGAAVGRSAAMPPWGNTLTAGEIVDVWQYIGSLARSGAQD